MRKTQTMTRIIRDPRDATKDYTMPADFANELFDAGKLAFDHDNGCYSHHEKERSAPPKWRKSKG